MTVVANRPPAIAWPRHAYISLPSPVATAIGTTPIIVVSVVIRMDLRRFIALSVIDDERMSLSVL